MMNPRYLFRRAVCGRLLALAGTFLLACNLTAQVNPVPAQSQEPARDQLPVESQVKLDKLQTDLKAAQIAHDACCSRAKTEPERGFI